MRAVHDMDLTSQRRYVGVGVRTLFVPAVDQRLVSSVGGPWWNEGTCWMRVCVGGAGVGLAAESVTMMGRCRRTGSYSPAIGRSPFLILLAVVGRSVQTKCEETRMWCMKERCVGLFSFFKLQLDSAVFPPMCNESQRGKCTQAPGVVGLDSPSHGKTRNQTDHGFLSESSA